MSEPTVRLDLYAPGDDLVLPFQIEGAGVRGRLVRLGPLLDRVLKKHNYPEPVSILVGEALVLAAMLGTSLKFDGRLTLQAQGNGPVELVVADFDAPGRLRAYAHMNRERVDELLAKGPVQPGDLLGEGHFAITIDQGPHMERYQGLVPLLPEGLTASTHEYFLRSEQIATRIRAAVGPLMSRGEGGETHTAWRAGAIMIQHLATDGGMSGYREEGEEHVALTDAEEDWNRSDILLRSVEDHELLDPDLVPERLLFRLFHEDGVRAFERGDLEFACRCSREKIENVLQQFTDEDIADMSDDGKIEVTCEFCSEVYLFSADSFQ